MKVVPRRIEQATMVLTVYYSYSLTSGRYTSLRAGNSDRLEEIIINLLPAKHEEQLPL
jgi:hypothetical protein